MLRSKKNYKSNSSGISLEQLLIALLIISLLNIAIFKFYSITIKQFLVIKNKLSMLHKKNVINFLLRNNINRSGCKGFASHLLLPEYTKVLTGYQHLPEAPIAVCKASVYNLNCLPFVNKKIMHKIIEQEIKPNTDILLVYDIPVNIQILSADMINYDSPLEINQKYIESFNIGDNIIIHDSQYLQRFIISGINQNQLLHTIPYNKHHNLIKKFKQNSKLIKVKHLAFYIAKNKGNQKNIYSLYMDDFSSLSNHAIAVIDNIEDLSVTIPTFKDKFQLLHAANIGWLYYEKFIIINLILKNKYSKKSENNFFSIGVEIRN